MHKTQSNRARRRTRRKHHNPFYEKCRSAVKYTLDAHGKVVIQRKKNAGVFSNWK
jgi:hypothetical protein